MSDITIEPIREYDSHDLQERPFTPENLEKARQVIARGKTMNWYLDWPSPRPHKMPCVPLRDVEWLLGYIDHLPGGQSEMTKESE